MNIVCDEINVIKRDNPYSLILKEWLMNGILWQSRIFAWKYNSDMLGKNAAWTNVSELDAIICGDKRDKRINLSEEEYCEVFNYFSRFEICGNIIPDCLQNEMMYDTFTEIRECFNDVIKNKNVLIFNHESFGPIVQNTSNGFLVINVSISGDNGEVIAAMEELLSSDVVYEIEMMITLCGNVIEYREKKKFIEEWAFRIGYKRACKLKSFCFVKLGGYK